MKHDALCRNLKHCSTFGFSKRIILFPTAAADHPRPRPAAGGRFTATPKRASKIVETRDHRILARKSTRGAAATPRVSREGGRTGPESFPTECSLWIYCTHRTRGRGRTDGRTDRRTDVTTASTAMRVPSRPVPATAHAGYRCDRSGREEADRHGWTGLGTRPGLGTPDGRTNREGRPRLGLGRRSGTMARVAGQMDNNTRWGR